MSGRLIVVRSPTTAIAGPLRRPQVVEWRCKSTNCMDPALHSCISGCEGMRDFNAVCRSGVPPLGS